MLKNENDNKKVNGNVEGFSADDAQSEDLVKQLDFYKDQLLRRVAEFENYKKRTEDKIVNIVNVTTEYLIQDILPVIDDLERSLNLGKEEKWDDPFYIGVEIIYSKLMKIFETKGLKQIEALNKPFDVQFHEATQIMERDDVEPDTVIRELLKGYMLNDKVIRHTKVVVSANSKG